MPRNHPCPFCERRCLSEWNLVRHVWKDHCTRRPPGRRQPWVGTGVQVVLDCEAGDRFLMECVAWRGRMPHSIDCFCDKKFTFDTLEKRGAIEQFLEHLKDAGGLAAHVLDLCLNGPPLGAGMETLHHERTLAEYRPNVPPVVPPYKFRRL